MAAFRGSGQIWANITESDGTKSGYLPFDNLAEFSIGIEGGSDTSLKSTSDEDYGAVIGAASVAGDDVGTIRFNEPNQNNLRFAFLGESEAIAIISGTATDEVVMTRDPGSHLLLANRKLTAFTSLRSAAGGGGTLYTPTTDYIVDLKRGMIQHVEGGALPEDTAIYATYNYDARSGYRINARRRPTLVCELFFYGVNLENNEVVTVYAPNVIAKPNQQGNFISVDNAFLEYGLSLILKVPDAGGDPYTLESFN